MRINSLLAVAAMAATVAQASAFEWSPTSLYPNPAGDIADTYFMSSVNFNCYVEGVAITDVMPVWVDEDGNELTAESGQQNPFGFDPSAFIYTFNTDEIKTNGEYILVFPEGMLVNADGEKSDKVQTFYTLDDPNIAPAMFDDFEVLSITPDFSQDQAVWNDQLVTINTNHNDAIGLTTLTITDNTTDEIVVTSSSFSKGRELGDSSPISWEVIGSYKFFEGHIYTAVFTFYNGKDETDPDGVPVQIVDRVSFDFAGRVEGFKYSDVELVSIDPAPMSVVISKPEQAVFTYTFSAPVTVYQAETPLGQNGKNLYPSSCLSSNEDKTVWTLDLSDDDYVKTVDAMLTIYIYARDLDGFQLKGDWGEENESCFMSEWQCDLGAFPIVVVTPEIGSTIDRLSEVVVKSESGEPMSWSWMGEVAVVNQLGDVLGTLVFDAPEDEEADMAMDEIRFTRWMDNDWNVTPIDLVKGGYYAVQFSPGCFLIGDQFESKQSQSLTSTFIISGDLEEPVGPVNPDEQEVFFYDKVAPEAGAVVTSLDRIQLWYPDVVACEEFTVNVYNAADQALVTTGAGLFDWEDWNLINIDFAEPVTVAGVYEVVIPARVIGDDAFMTSGGSEGICNPEIRLSYTVDPDGNAVVSVAASAEADVYDLNGRVVLRGATSEAVKTLPKGIYVVGGRKLVIK